MTVPTEAPSVDPEYTIFISYSHRDNRDPGRKWATWLQLALEDYEVPPDLIRAERAKGHEMPASLYPVFRDEEDLQAGSDLTEKIRHALARSRWLVVICSPRAVASEFVPKEIQLFKELRKGREILAFMIDGEPGVAGPSNDGGARAGECLPESLRIGAPRLDGSPDWEVPTEPIAADARPGNRAEQGWTSSADYAVALAAEKHQAREDIRQAARAYEEQLELAKLRIIAAVLDVPLRELTQRNRKRQLEKARAEASRFRRWLTAVGVLAILAGAFGIVAWGAQRRARQESAARQSQLMEASRSAHAIAERLFREAETAGDVERAGQALAYLDQAIEFDPANRAAIRHAASAILYATLPRRPLCALPGWAAKYSPDGHLLLALEGDPPVAHLWDLARQTEIGRFPSKDFPRFAPDSRTLYFHTGSVLQRWQPGAAGPQVSFDHPGEVRGFDLSADGKLLATLCFDERLRLWDTASGKEAGDLALPGAALTLCFDRAGAKIAVAFKDGSVRVFSCPDLRLQTGPLPHPEAVSSLRWSNAGQVLAECRSPSPASRLFVWDAAAGLLLGRGILTPYGAKPNAAGERLLTWEENNATLWDLCTAAPVGPPLAHPEGLGVHAGASSPDGRTVATGFDGSDPGELGRGVRHTGFIQLWDVETREPRGEPLRQDSIPRELAFSPDGRWLFALDNTGAIRVWEPATRRTVGGAIRCEEKLSDLAISPDGRTLTASTWQSKERRIIVWPLGDQAFHGEDLDPHEAQQRRLESQPGSFVAQESADKKGIQIINRDTGQPVGEEIRHNTPISFDLDARHGLLATVTEDQELRVWNGADGTLLLGPHPVRTSICSVDFSPDGSLVAAKCGLSENEGVEIWSLRAKRLLCSIPAEERLLLHATFSPDGTKLALRASLAHQPGVDGVWLYRLPTGEPLTRPLAHPGSVTGLAFTADSRFLASASDGLVRFWDVERGVPASEPAVGFGGSEGIALSKDERWVTAFRVGGAHRIEIPQVVAPPPQGLLRLLAHYEATERGAIERTSFERWRALRQQVEAELSHRPTADPWLPLARWALAAPWKRPLAPHGTLLAEEWFVHPLSNTPLFVEGAVLSALASLPEDMRARFDAVTKKGRGRSLLTDAPVAMEEGMLARIRRSDPGHPFLPLRDAAQEKDVARRDFLLGVAVERLKTAALETQRLAMMFLLTRIDPPQPERVLAIADAALLADPRFLSGYIFKGRALLALGRPAEAAHALGKGEEIAQIAGEDPDPENLIVLAQAQWLADQNDKAVATYIRLVERSIQWGSAQMIVAMQNVDAAERERLEAIRSVAMKRRPDLREMAATLVGGTESARSKLRAFDAALAAWRAGEKEEAVKAYLALVESDPQFACSHAAHLLSPVGEPRKVAASFAELHGAALEARPEIADLDPPRESTLRVLILQLFVRTLLEVWQEGGRDPATAAAAAVFRESPPWAEPEAIFTIQSEDLTPEGFAMLRGQYLALREETLRRDPAIEAPPTQRERLDRQSAKVLFATGLWHSERRELALGVFGRLLERSPCWGNPEFRSIFAKHLPEEFREPFEELAKAGVEKFPLEGWPKPSDAKDDIARAACTAAMIWAGGLDEMSIDMLHKILSREPRLLQPAFRHGFGWPDAALDHFEAALAATLDKHPELRRDR